MSKISVKCVVKCTYDGEEIIYKGILTASKTEIKISCDDPDDKTINYLYVGKNTSHLFRLIDPENGYDELRLFGYPSDKNLMGIWTYKSREYPVKISISKKDDYKKIKHLL